MNEDWEKPTILRKGRISSKDARSTAAINKAMTTGNAEIHKKSDRPLKVFYTYFDI